MCKQTIKTGSGGAIRGLDVDFYDGRIFCSCHDDGYIYEYQIDQPITAVSKNFKKVRIAKLAKLPVLGVTLSQEMLYFGQVEAKFLSDMLEENYAFSRQEICLLGQFVQKFMFN